MVTDVKLRKEAAELWKTKKEKKNTSECEKRRSCQWKLWREWSEEMMISAMKGAGVGEWGSKDEKLQG